MATGHKGFRISSLQSVCLGVAALVLFAAPAVSAAAGSGGAAPALPAGRVDALQPDPGGTTLLFVDQRPDAAAGPAIQRTFAVGDSTFSVTRLGDNGITAAIDRLDGTPGLTLVLAAAGRVIAPGAYGNTSSMPVSWRNRLQASGTEIGCPLFSTGRYVVYEVEYEPDGRVRRLSVDFEERCGLSSTVVWGAFRYHATVGGSVPFGGAYPAWRLTVTPSPGGRVTGAGLDCGAGAATCVLDLASAATVSLQAVPDPGAMFAGWSGDCAGSATTELAVEGVRACQAHFQPVTPVAPRSVLVLEGAPGEFLTGGRSDVMSPAGSRWLVFSDPEARAVQFAVTTLTTGWELSIGTATAPPLAPGWYAIGGPAPGFVPLSLSFGGYNGCAPVGRLRILEVAVAGDGSLASFAADFEQHCFDGYPALFGSVRYNSTVPIDPAGIRPPAPFQLTISPPANGRVSGAGLDCGVGASACALVVPAQATVHIVAEPAAGYIFAGWTGDCAGAAGADVAITRAKTCGAAFEPAAGIASRTLFLWEAGPGTSGPSGSAVFSTANSLWGVTADDGRSHVKAVLQAATGPWSLDLFAGGGQPLAPGSYGAARLYPVSYGNGLRFDIDSFGCAALTGRFVVSEIAFDSAGAVTRLAADFEYHCNDEDAAGFGAIRYQSSMLDGQPFGGAYPLYRLTIAPPSNGRVTGPGLDCGGTGTACATTLSAPSRLFLRAVAAPGYFFTGWTGDCHGVESTSLSVNSDRACGARFAMADGTPLTILRLSSEPGEWVWQGAHELYTDANSSWSVVRPVPDEIDVRITGVGERQPADLLFSFRAPGGAPLQTGHYPLDPWGAQMLASANGRSCGGTWSLNGWFTVRELVADTNGLVQGLAIDFEQRCAANAPAIRGSLRYHSSVPAGVIGAVQPSMRFVGVTRGGAAILQPPAQTLRLLREGSGDVTWTAQTDQPWLTISPAAGSGSGALTVNASLLPGGPVSGEVTGRILFAFQGAFEGTLAVDVTLRAVAEGTTTGPIGAVDTPVEGPATVSGAVPFTGWALDDLGVAEVTVCRDAVAPAETAASEARCGGAAQLYVGGATFIEGARPDVAAYYQWHPRRYEAGWGLMVLTNMLPQEGNGTYRFSIYARDTEGQTVLLGRRSLAVANQLATRPFGTIDTPAQGETVSGTEYVSFGWALTQPPKFIPADGSTLMVHVDGVAVGPPSYNHYRSDIAAAFPGYANTDGAVGYRLIDTTTLGDGLHTIVWTATDSQGMTEGLGSRYFRVANGAGATAASGNVMAVVAEGSAEARLGAPLDLASMAALPAETAALQWRRGWAADAPWRTGVPSPSGRVVVRGEEIDRFELRLGPDAGGYEGYARTGDGLGPLPIGSRLDAATGRFTWSPGVGFIGAYDLVFVRRTAAGSTRRDVRIVIASKGSGRIGPHVVIDTPRPQQDVPQPFVLAGWAADLDAAAGTGIATVHVWAYPLTGAAPIFLGIADYGGARPDVAAVHGDQFERSGFALSVQGLEHGNYDLAVFGWSQVTGGFVPAAVVRLTVR